MIQGRESNPAAGRRTATILLADENPRTRQWLASVLEGHGCDVVPCRDGVRLLDALNTFIFGNRPTRFDVVLCDLHMSGIDGLDLLRGMQGYIGFPPIILMSEGIDAAMDAKARELGAAMVLGKPVDPRQLVSVIDEQRPLECRSLTAQSGSPPIDTFIPSFLTQENTNDHECR